MKPPSQPTQNYHFISRLFHWLMAILFVILFAMGKWMHDLEYTHEFYQLAPSIHAQIGIIIGILWVARLIWRFLHPPPKQQEISVLEKKMSYIVHWLFYILFPLITISGYLLYTSDGNGMVFLTMQLPTLIESRSIGEFASEIHEFLTVFMLVIAGLHALAALKHHYIDKDNVLKSMLRGK